MRRNDSRGEEGKRTKKELKKKKTRQEIFGGEEGEREEAEG